MGDRICLTFVDNHGEKSPCLYAHWEGMHLIELAKEFWETYRNQIRDEPSNWMVNFISWIRGGDVADGSYYLYPTEKDSCSPDDNGYWRFNTDTGEAVCVEGEEWIV